MRFDQNFSRVVKLAAAVGLVVVAGCGHSGIHDPGLVAKEWSMMMREFNIVPVFPPREDVQVGDVYSMPLPPGMDLQMDTLRGGDGKFLPIGTHLARLNVTEELTKYYSASISLPATPDFSSSPTGTGISQPTFAPGKEFAGDITRPRLGGFPEFFSVKIASGSIDAVVPTEVVNIVAAVSGSSEKTVRVSVPMVETYGLPANIMVKKVTSDGKTLAFGESSSTTQPTTPQPTTTTQTISADDLKALLGPAGGFDEETQKRVDEWLAAEKVKSGLGKEIAGYVVLITEVYATRAIDISIASQSSNAAGLNLKPTAALLEDLTGVKATTQPTQATTPPTKTDETNPGPAAATNTGSSADAGIERAKTTQLTQLEALNQQLSANAPGVNVKFTSVTAFGVSMRRTFERPVVIGYRGIVYRVNSDMTVALAGSASGIHPVNVQVSSDEVSTLKTLHDFIRVKLPNVRKDFKVTLDGPYFNMNLATGWTNEEKESAEKALKAAFDELPAPQRKDRQVGKVIG